MVASWFFVSKLILSLRLVKVSLFLTLCTQTVSVDYCNIKTCANSSLHTMCQYKTEAVDKACDEVVAKGLTPELRQVVLRAHNYWRQQVANGLDPKNPASNMMKLVWHEEAEEIAQRWANQCKTKGSNDSKEFAEIVHDACRDLEDSLVGQNIISGPLGDCPTGLNTSETIALKAVRNWAHGRYPATTDSYFVNTTNYTKPTSGGEFLTSDFSQLIWATTKAVGCGYLELKPDKNGLTMFRLYCNYVPKGNINFSPVYLTGTPCSKCPNDTKCSASFPGLCRALTDSDDTPFSTTPKYMPVPTTVASGGQRLFSSKWFWFCFVSATFLFSLLAKP